LLSCLQGRGNQPREGQQDETRQGNQHNGGERQADFLIGAAPLSELRIPFLRLRARADRISFYQFSFQQS
jgi:hypothetical protein